MEANKIRRHKPPYLHIVKRAPLSRGRILLIYLSAVFAALACGGLLVSILGYNPFAVYAQILRGSLSTATAFRETVKMAVPLLISGIAVAIAFKLKFWNIGAEGQILIGGFATMLIPIYWPGLPAALKLPLMALAAIIAAGLFACLPAFFKVRWSTNETLFTLMLNYIALQWVRYLQNCKSWMDRGTMFPKIRPLNNDEILPQLFGVHIGWLIALLLVVMAWFYLKRSKHGFEIAVVGDSENTARYVGMNVPRIVQRSIFISGAIAGLCGYFQVAGADGALTESTAGGIGFTAIIVAWLAQLNPFLMLIVAFGLAILQKGSLSIASTMGIPNSAANLLSGIILFFILASHFFLNYRWLKSRSGLDKSRRREGGALYPESQELPYSDRTVKVEERLSSQLETVETQVESSEQGED